MLQTQREENGQPCDLEKAKVVKHNEIAQLLESMGINKLLDALKRGHAILLDLRLG